MADYCNMLEIFFVTSNNIKLAHARHLCRDYDVLISTQKHYGRSYSEPRIYDREQLLELSLKDALQRFRKSDSGADDRFFFIEDTSVIISALSRERETPGVDIKFWMQENTFASIDAQLKAHGDDRAVEVRSDLILQLPYKLQLLLEEEYKRFTSSTRGSICASDQYIAPRPLYPWLDDRSFNKWFVPQGCTQPMSLLSIELADKYDFRAGAFQHLLTFLEEHAHVKKRQTFHFVKPAQWHDQPRLFEDRPLMVITGATCAGKTTLATYVAENYAYRHIEASDFMYLSYYRSHGVGSSVRIGDFAKEALERDPSIVVDQVVQEITKILSFPICVTGFRSPREVDLFQSALRSTNMLTLFVEADKLLRFQRCLIRKRPEDSSTLEEFEAADLQQNQMGLELICSRPDITIVHNNSTFEGYFQNFERLCDKQLTTAYSPLKGAIPGYLSSQRLEEQILLALWYHMGSKEYYTTAKIAALINELPWPNGRKRVQKSKNNVSRYFNQYFYPYYEILCENGKRKYRLSQTGAGRALCLIRQMKGNGSVSST